MANIWKKMETKDKREILFALIKCSSLDEAADKAKKTSAFLKAHHADDQSHMSLSAESFTVVLHAYSPEPIHQKDWDMARQLEKILEA